MPAQQLSGPRIEDADASDTKNTKGRKRCTAPYSPDIKPGSPSQVSHQLPVQAGRLQLSGRETPAGFIGEHRPQAYRDTVNTVRKYSQ